MKADAPQRDVDAVCITGNTGPIDPDQFATLPGVIEVIRVTRPFKLTSRDMKPHDTLIDVGGVQFGGRDVAVIAGPCAVESRQQMVETALRLKELGAQMLRGGAFKPRTSPYSFQGLGRKGLEILAEAREQSGLPVVTEAVSPEQVDLVAEFADAIQIGARNMQNYALLKKAGQARKPVLLKRGIAATFEEFLLAAEYIMAEGNHNVMLCERGIRTFSDFSRFTLDLSVVPELERISHLPVIVDPSHAAGRREIVIPLARAAIAAGADGLIVEAHHDPDHAVSDGPQTLSLKMFAEMMDEIRMIVPAVKRHSVTA